MTLLFLINLISCGPGRPNWQSLLDIQPQVILSEPQEGEIAAPPNAIKIIFSLAVDPTSVGPNSFAVIKLEEEGVDPKEVAEDVKDQEIDVIAGTYYISDDFTEAVFTPDSLLQKGSSFGIIATDLVKTKNGIPLNQTPGEEPTPFWTTFKIAGSNSSQLGGSDGFQGDAQEQENEEVLAGPRPSWFLINELLYDASGNETDGNLFVELAGEAGSDISSYEVVFINGANGEITESIKIEPGSVIPSDGIFLIADSRTGASEETNIAGADMLDNFDPQNGPDCVALLDDHGALFDALGYGSPLPLNGENGIICYEGAPAEDAPAGSSLSRTGLIDSGNNAADFIILEISTPGVP